jgi:uncharacterized protein YjiS (DUF1127 family)
MQRYHSSWVPIGAAKGKRLDTFRPISRALHRRYRRAVSNCEPVCFRGVAGTEYFGATSKETSPAMTTERLSFDLVEFGPPGSGILRRLSASLARWRERERQRAALAQLPAYVLRDLGLPEGAVGRETHWMI